MTRLLGIITIILALVLFPPAALALISNNAVPGDSTYPIKLGLENGILFFASFNPTTKAWFAAARSDRRYQEVEILLAQGKNASPSLEELVIQTEKAASEIKNVEGSKQKQELVNKLSESISKYDQGLQKAVERNEIPISSPSPEPTSIPTALPSPTSKSGINQTPIPSIRPTPASAVTPTPVVTPTPAPLASHPSDEVEQIQKARERLEQIKQRLEEEKNKGEEKDKKDENKQENEDKEKRVKERE